MSKLIYGVGLLCVAYIIGWHMLYGPLISDWFKKYQFITIWLSVPNTLISIYSVGLISEYFNGKVWPNRIFSFSVGIILFTILANIHFDEKMNFKTFSLLALSGLIVALQILWK
jgi:hypothetical protein